MGLGLSGGGVGTAEFLQKHGAKVTVTDLRTPKDLAPSLKALAKYQGIRYVLGRHRKDDFRSADLVIKNPGVRRDNPYLKAAQQYGVPVTSDLGIFFDLCPGRIIGITGTRGKSTATYLLWQMLKTKFPRTHYGGNIRRSVLSVLPKIKKGDPVVLELSSFQLMDLDAEDKSPSVAIITNIMPDHLNWHISMREYRDSKTAIFRHQRSQKHSDIVHNVGMSGGTQNREDLVIIPAGDQVLEKMVRGAHSRLIRAALAPDMQKVVDKNLGVHYRASAALAAEAARALGVPHAAIIRTLSRFHGLPGRQEEVAVHGGVHFINDTTATIPEAAVAAVRRFREKAGRHRLILITGGQDKKLDFSRMDEAVRKSVDALVLLPGTATEKLAQILAQSRRVLSTLRKVKSMREGVRRAWQSAEKGDYILLSPGAASFGLFLNEFDRGQQFVDAVRRLKTLNPVIQLRLSRQRRDRKTDIAEVDIRGKP